MARTPGDFLNSYLPYLLRQADQALSASWYQQLNERGIERSDWRVLAVLHERGSLSIRDLADTALSPQPTVTHAVARLEKRGLVRRLRGTRDKRQRFVSVTEDGLRLAAGLIAEATDLQADALDRADLGDLAPLISELRSLSEGLDHQEVVNG